jgi:predicted membrane protein
MDSPSRNARRAVFGLSVIGIGTLAMLDNLHLFDMALLHTFWPLVFVLWGIARLVWPRHSGSQVFGVGLILLGTLITAYHLEHRDLDLSQWWPVFVILAGASIVSRGMFPHGRFGRAEIPPPAVQNSDVLNIEATFGALELRNDAKAFKGGRIEVSFGSIELDLREAVMDGAEVAIDIRCSFSGVELRVPRDWEVVVQLRATMGAVEDRSVPPSTPVHRLVLRGASSFGGVEIRN